MSICLRNDCFEADGSAPRVKLLVSNCVIFNYVALFITNIKVPRNNSIEIEISHRRDINKQKSNKI